MLRILFVDDDANLLDSLCRMSHTKRGEWQTEFADSGKTALEILEREKFDVIVTDMRMPEMDGGTLLKSVAQKYPNTLRFVLSGHSDKDLILKAIPWTHQFLAKPCEIESLQQKINSSMELRGLLADPLLHKRLSSVRSLPSLPATYTQLCSELQSDVGTVRSAAKIIESDIGLTAKILQLVNSAFFSLPRHIEHLEQAVSLLGLETIRALTLMTGVFSEVSSSSAGSTSAAYLFDHSASVSSIAKSLAQHLGLSSQEVDESFFAGALHDIGKLIILYEFKAELIEIEKLSSQDDLTPIEAELVCLGVSHAIIGAHLLSIWGIPHPIIEAVACHHTPAVNGNNELSPTTAVYLADQLVHARTSGKTLEEFKGGLDLEYLTSIGILDKLEEVYEVGAKISENERIGI